ncbi:MAG: enoyl-CoA hydratase/isomerase family protein [Aeromicrobium sp.]
MSGYGAVRYELDDTIATVTLNRPDKYNAINREMVTELVDVFRRVRDEPTVGVVILSGAGKSFCTGGDLSIFPSILAGHASALNWLAHDGYELGKAIELCEKVVIAKVHGHCLAGGLELALMCDLVYATASARFGATEINMGLLPGWGGTVRLARAMPIHRAREIVYSGRKDYTAHDMYEMGLLTRVWPDDSFDDAFAAAVDGIAAKQPIALRMGKEVMARSLETPGLDAALALERNAIQWLISAPNMQASMTRPSPNSRHRVTHQRQAGADSAR